MSHINLKIRRSTINKTQGVLQTILGLFMYSYLIMNQVMTVVYFIKPCREWDSIVKMILLGPVLGRDKGLAVDSVCMALTKQKGNRYVFLKIY